MATSNLIAFAGRAGSGKSTMARVLVTEGGFKLVKFADTLKSMLGVIYEHAGYSAEETLAKIEGHLKETPCRVFGGQTPRFAMQTLGTEWGRDIMSQGIWLRIWTARVCRLMSMGMKVVVDDLRFPNELAAVQFLGGMSYTVLPDQIEDETSAMVTDHISEARTLKTDCLLHNVGSVEDLKELARLVAELPSAKQEPPS